MRNPFRLIVSAYYRLMLRLAAFMLKRAGKRLFREAVKMGMKVGHGERTWTREQLERDTERIKKAVEKAGE